MESRKLLRSSRVLNKVSLNEGDFYLFKIFSIYTNILRTLPSAYCKRLADLRVKQESCHSVSDRSTPLIFNVPLIPLSHVILCMIVSRKIWYVNYQKVFPLIMSGGPSLLMWVPEKEFKIKIRLSFIILHIQKIYLHGNNLKCRSNLLQ